MTTRPDPSTTAPDALEGDGRLVGSSEASFDRARRTAGLLLAPVAFAIGWMAAGGLAPEGRTLFGILGAVVVLWVTESLPLPVTALLGAILSVVLGVARARIRAVDPGIG